MQNNFWAFLVFSNGKDFLNNTKLFFIPMIWGLIFKIHVRFSAAHCDSTDTPTLVAQAHHSLLLYQRKGDTGDGHRCELDPPGRSLLWSPTRACGRKGTAGRRQSRGEGSWVWRERTNKSQAGPPSWWQHEASSPRPCCVMFWTPEIHSAHHHR